MTDPILFNKIGIRVGSRKVGMKRLTPSKISIDEIPHVDYVVLSHAHMDHWDMESLEALTKKFPDTIHFICPKNTTSLLRRIPAKKAVTEIERHEEIAFGDIIFRAWETRHRWARRPWEHKKYSVWHTKAKWYNSYLISHSTQDKHIVFGWDTAYTTAYEKLAENIDSVDVAIMPIWAYDPWESSHCTPEQAVEMAKQMRTKRFIPVHYETFRLDQAQLKSPITRLVHALSNESDIELAITNIGDVFVL